MTATPDTPVRERIILADALRGFALMGLYIVHMVEYFELYWYKPEPGWVHNLIFFLFGGKAYGIFALLFGLSFFIILDNYKQRGIDFRARFCWRLILLLAFGYLHSLLYAGDILQLLALCGFFLVLTHALSTRALIIIAAFFLVQIPHIIIVGVHTLAPDANYTEPKFYALMAKNFDMFAHADLPSLIAYNLFEGQIGKWSFFLETGRFWNIIGLMYVGAVLGRLGFFERRQHQLKQLLAAIVIALLCFAALRWLSPVVVGQFPGGMAAWTASQLISYYINLSLITTGVLLFVLLFQHTSGKKLLSFFAPVGRMTLTFYLGQSLVFVPVYYGFGLGGYDFLGQQWSLILGLVLWLAQMAIAAWWLEHHRYGPLEKLWRKLTFLGFQQNR